MWVLGGEKQFLGAGPLDQSSLIEHGNLVRDAPNQTKIVRDEQVCKLPPLLQVQQQFDNLSLHGQVKPGKSLVQDQNPGSKSERSGNGQPLPLATAQLKG